MVTDTLRAMALGGMRDHVGGGFHRYSVDAAWRVPHFEKMLYDQAQLVLAYLEAAQATGDELLRAVAEDTLDYVLRELTDPLGGFYSAEDADSLPPDTAGTGRCAQVGGGVLHLVRQRDRRAARRRRRRSRGAASASSRAATRRRIRKGSSAAGTSSTSRQSIHDIAARTGRRAEAEVAAALGRMHATLFAGARAARPRPHLDDKVLTAWNGLMIAAFARAARVLAAVAGGGALPRGGAEGRARSSRDPSVDCAEQGGCCAAIRDGDAAIDAYAEDFASLIYGLLELFQADGDPAWLEWAVELQAAPGRAVLGRAGGRRLVQHDRDATPACCCG